MRSSGVGGNSVGMAPGICKNRPGTFKGSERVTTLPQQSLQLASFPRESGSSIQQRRLLGLQAGSKQIAALTKLGLVAICSSASEVVSPADRSSVRLEFRSSLLYVILHMPGTLSVKRRCCRKYYRVSCLANDAAETV